MVKYYFVVGTKDLDRDLRLQLEMEPDLLMLPIKDSYRRLTIKILSAITVLDHGFNFQYLFKVDDDAFIRVPEIVQDLLDNQPRERHYQGYFFGGTPVIRDDMKSKWYEPDYPICDRYVHGLFWLLKIEQQKKGLPTFRWKNDIGPRSKLHYMNGEVDTAILYL